MGGPDATDSATTFELVSDETRLAILRALADYRCEYGHGEWPTFSALRERAGVGDAANFNYHLDRLVGQFVERDDGEYRLTYRGEFVVGSLLAGAYATETSRELPVESACPFCGEPQAGSFESGTVRITCPNDHGFSQELPPGTVADRSPSDVLSLAATEMRTNVERVVAGVCPMCYGELETELADSDVEGVDRIYVADCTRCGHRFGGPPAFLALVDPALVSFYRDHGLDLSERPLWTCPFPDHEVRVVSESPPELRLIVRLDGDELRATMDGNAVVVDARRA